MATGCVGHNGCDERHEKSFHNIEFGGRYGGVSHEIIDNMPRRPILGGKLL